MNMIFDCRECSKTLEAIAKLDELSASVLPRVCAKTLEAITPRRHPTPYRYCTWNIPNLPLGYSVLRGWNPFVQRASERRREMGGGGGGGDKKKLMEQVFHLRLTSKGLVRQAKKCEAEEAKEKLKIKKAMEKGNADGARVYAQNAIRKHAEQLNYLRLASRLDAVVARLASQATSQGVCGALAGIVASLHGALAVGNMQKVSRTMDAFERAFVGVEVQAAFVEGAMAGSTSLATPEESVSGLMLQVADAHGLEVGAQMPQPGIHRVAVAAPPPRSGVSEDELCRRLAQLKNKS